ncbi:hypothetical protein D3C81_2267700 [compost metagenome]
MGGTEPEFTAAIVVIGNVHISALRRIDGLVSDCTGRITQCVFNRAVIPIA